MRTDGREYSSPLGLVPARTKGRRCGQCIPVELKMKKDESSSPSEKI